MYSYKTEDCMIIITLSLLRIMYSFVPYERKMKKNGTK